MSPTTPSTPPAHTPHGRGENTPAAPTPQETEAHNARVIVASQGLVNVADQLTAAKTVLPWLMVGAGVPTFFIALLVPIRESGSMLPQISISGRLEGFTNRVGLWQAGALTQALCAAGIAVSALALSGVALGIAVTVLLAGLALARAVCSITVKDVQGRVIPKGRRGRVTGRATAIGGAVAVSVGLGLKVWGANLPTAALAALVGGGAAAWVAAALVFGAITGGNADSSAGRRKHPNRDAVALLRGDKDFRRFVIVRSLLLVSALSPTFVVALSQRHGDELSGLAPFVLASGVAALIGGRISGLLADVSSKKTMVAGAAFVSAIILALIALEHSPARHFGAVVLPVGFFLIALAHTAIRVARKTYVVDMAEGTKRTEYVAVANSVLGVVLLVVGVVSGGFALVSPEAALAFLAATGLVGVVYGAGLKDVSAH